MGMWIDFRQLRESLDVQKVLQYYRVEFKRRGTQAVARCPLPKHPKDGKSQTFSVNFEKRVFQCFGCGGKGNVLDFIAFMERLNPRDSREFRKAAEIAQERFGTQTQQKRQNANNSKPIHSENMKAPSKTATPMVTTDLPVLVNEPLDFELRNLDPKPQYLLNRGFTEQTIKYFGLGYCTKGTFAGRVVIPLHDQQGRLIGYAGRTIFDDAIDAENPKYLFPGRRERNGHNLEFAKSLFVYNGHRIKAPVHDLIIVQGFPSVWWVWQHGYENVVALMGSRCSVDQGKAIVQLVVRMGLVWLVTNAGKTGENCAINLFNEIGVHRFCRLVRLRQGQPTDCDSKQLHELLVLKT